MNRKTVYGIGINDADYPISITEDYHTTWRCPYYSVWSNMLKRCYDKSTQQKQKSYMTITVCEEWHTFSTFRLWMKTQDWKNKQIDKDLIVLSSKFYSPLTCCFITSLGSA